MVVNLANVCCAYYRVSSDDQEASLPKQQKEVRAWAKEHGVTILREYIDSGKSGVLEQEKREDFQRLLMDSSKKDFAFCLVFKNSRFGRQDSIEAAFAKGVLRSNGIYLQSVLEGKTDWNTFQGRIADVVASEMNHAYSQDLSKETCKGRLNALDNGGYPNAAVPFGYDRLYIAPDGRETRVKRTEFFRKPRNWTLQLVINEEEAVTIRYLFEAYATRDIGIYRIAKEMTAKGLPSPTSKGFTDKTLRDWLPNETYIGTVHIGKGRNGRKSKKEALRRIPPTTKENACPAIVDRKHWDAVQKKLSRPRSRVQFEKASPLSSLLKCGQCNHAMTVTRRYGKVFFACQTIFKRPGKKCHHIRVPEKFLKETLCKYLVEKVDRELIRLHTTPVKEEKICNLDILERQAETIQAEIDKATKRYLKAPDFMLSGLEKEIASMRQKLSDVEGQLLVERAKENQETMNGFRAWWGDVRQQIFKVAGPEYVPFVPTTEKEKEVLAAMEQHGMKCHGKIVSDALFADESKFREFCHRIGLSLTLYFKPTGKGKPKFMLDMARLEGEIKFPDVLASLSSPYQYAPESDTFTLVLNETIRFAV